MGGLTLLFIQNNIHIYKLTNFDVADLKSNGRKICNFIKIFASNERVFNKYGKVGFEDEI